MDKRNPKQYFASRPTHTGVIPESYWIHTGETQKFVIILFIFIKIYFPIVAISIFCVANLFTLGIVLGLEINIERSPPTPEIIA